ncbi:GNAT family N-acetyltransferase [Salarchaeum japonicum]|uniref:N-acetyltransferase domain-containing protein n=1 Tax=Salarchaeum japonicum TaxID=555573 RepID=A0AAV3T3N0_9EURY|nr:GNAT family N-acetyltransferase [Salarchaeum japonicum]
MALTIRRYEPGDREAADAVIEAALRHANAYFEDAPALVDDDRIAEYVESGGEFLVGVLNGDLVATAAFRPPKGVAADLATTDGDTAEVKRMHVHPEHHRRGFGQAMYDELEARARDAGYERFVLSTSARQEPAHAFYRQNGYEQTARTTVTIDGGDLGILVFEKPL